MSTSAASCSPIVSISAAAPRLHLFQLVTDCMFQLLLPDCVHCPCLKFLSIQHSGGVKYEGCTHVASHPPPPPPPPPPPCFPCHRHTHTLNILMQLVLMKSNLCRYNIHLLCNLCGCVKFMNLQWEMSSAGLQVDTQGAAASEAAVNK